MNESYPYGYSGFAEENLGKGYGEKTLPDLKECFAVGPSNPAAGMPPVQWPQNPAEMQAVWTEYYGAMETLSSNLLKLCGMCCVCAWSCAVFSVVRLLLRARGKIRACFMNLIPLPALGLRLDEDWFEDKITRHRSCLRALNYPHQDKTPEAGQIRAGAHTDYGSLTILAQDDAGGLQVRNATGEWQDIEPTPGAYVINLGDLMARWTNDRWVSTLHRVVNPQDIAGITARRGTTRRQSMAFFHNINHDHLVECIPTCASASNPVKSVAYQSCSHFAISPKLNPSPLQVRAYFGLGPLDG